VASTPPLDSSAHRNFLFSSRSASPLLASACGRVASVMRLGVRGLTGGMGESPLRPSP
jgi:hypothetical protein